MVLTNLGLEVESVDDKAATFNGFVVGLVVEKVPHPSADKLSVCTVDVGESETKTIVCGAPNVDAQQLVPVALVGAKIPSANIVIELRSLRGVSSEGMICSKAELGLGLDSDGIWILDVDAPPGTPLAIALNLTDVVYDVAVTPNRADCLSHVGIARDLFAYQYVHDANNIDNSSWKHSNAPSIDLKSGDVSVVVEDKELCPHYVAQVVKNLKPVESPEWLKNRLLALGLRPRNLIVDVTNYVNMELGQPLHAFDASKLAGNSIVVRRAGKSEKSFVTLDGKTNVLSEQMLMICDSTQPVAIAGVMGGNNSEVDENTTSVVIESAYFNPTSIRRTAKLLGLNTDASYRFERGVNPDGIRAAADRAAQLLCELAGAQLGARIEIGAPITKQNPIGTSYNTIRSLVGADISNATITRMLEAIGCIVQKNNADSSPDLYSVVAPAWRGDVSITADLAEEVMRLFGIDNIPPSTMARTPLDVARMPLSLKVGGEHGRKIRDTLRTLLCARGYHDCVTNVLNGPSANAVQGEKEIRLKNALGAEFSALRQSLVPGLLRVASHNLRHGSDCVRLMEMGYVFSNDSSQEFGVLEQEQLTMLITGSADAHWSTTARSLDFYDIAGDVSLIARDITTHPAEPSEAYPEFSHVLSTIKASGIDIGFLGALRTDLATQFEIKEPVYAAIIFPDLIPVHQPRYSPISQYPSVRRDLAFIVEDRVRAGQIVEVVKKAGTSVLRSVDVFDVYSGKGIDGGAKSIGVEMTFRADDRTLRDAEVDAEIATIISTAGVELGARIRGVDVP